MLFGELVLLWELYLNDQTVIATEFLGVVALGGVELPRAELGEDQLVMSLRTWGYTDLSRSVDRFDFDCRSKNGLNERDWHFRDDVLSVSSHCFVLLDPDCEEKVPSWRAIAVGAMAQLGKLDLLAVGHALRQVYALCDVHSLQAQAFACGTWRLHLAPRPLTFQALLADAVIGHFAASAATLEALSRLLGHVSPTPRAFGADHTLV